MTDRAGELHGLLKAYKEAWSTHDAESVAAFFSRDADMVVGNHPRVSGRDAIEAWWSGYFANIDEGRKGAFEAESIRMITPEVALVNVGSTTAGTGSGGEKLPTRLARGTWVLVRTEGQWWITALRVLPAEGEVRVTPGTDR